MASLAPAGTALLWKRLLETLAAFAAAAETDGYTYHDQRLASLERRIGALEGTRPATNVAGRRS